MRKHGLFTIKSPALLASGIGPADDGMWTFDKLPNRYMDVDQAEGSRAVGVHSAGIIEGPKTLHRTNTLVAELTGGAR